MLDGSDSHLIKILLVAVTDPLALVQVLLKGAMELPFDVDILVTRENWFLECTVQYACL